MDSYNNNDNAAGIYGQTQGSYPNIWNSSDTGGNVRDGSDQMDFVPSFLSNGIRMAWTKYNGGTDVTWKAILLG